MEETMAYLSCNNCGDLLYYTKEDFDEEEGLNSTYFRDEKDRLLFFCTPHCMSEFIKDNYKPNHTINGGESGAFRRCL
jgi:hypothetical protein